MAEFMGFFIQDVEGSWINIYKITKFFIPKIEINSFCIFVSTKKYPYILIERSFNSFPDARRALERIRQNIEYIDYSFKKKYPTCVGILNIWENS